MPKTALFLLKNRWALGVRPQTFLPLMAGALLSDRQPHPSYLILSDVILWRNYFCKNIG